jgi:5-methylthioadenosine/S-adenosylhomocysteine deaminase
MVGGEVVVRDGAPTRFDLSSAAREFAERMERAPSPAEVADTVRRLRPHIAEWYGRWEMPTPRPYIAYNSRI